MSDSPIQIFPAFQSAAKTAALDILTDILGSKQAEAAATRIAVALTVLGRRTPAVFEADPETVMECIAASALSGLMVGGPMPTCYVLPRKRRFKQGDEWKSVVELNWQLAARGMISLAHRGGYLVTAHPLYPGRAAIFDATNLPTERLPHIDRSLDNLIGVVVKVRRMSDGMNFGDHFVEVDLIEERRKRSDAWQQGQDPNHTEGYGRNAKVRPKTPDEVARSQSSPWYEWPEEMALKTAIRYVCQRGYIPLDDAGQRALEYDGKRDNVVIDVPSESVNQTRAAPVTGRAALGMDTGPGVQDFAAEAARLRERDAQRLEPADAKPETKTEPAKTAEPAKADPKAKPPPKSQDPAEVISRLSALGVTVEMAEHHIKTPRVAWTSENLAALVRLGASVKSGAVKLESLAVPVEPDPGEGDPSDGFP